MAGVKGRSGGARTGSGRKPKSERYAVPIGKAEAAIAARLPEFVEHLIAIGQGGRERVREVYKAAAGGDPVLVERVVETAAPDARALMYLIDRIMDKPATAAPTPAAVAVAMKALIGVDIERV